MPVGNCSLPCPSVPSVVRRGAPGQRVPLEAAGPEECGPSLLRFGYSDGPAGARWLLLSGVVLAMDA
eukprot:8654458-Lingulodinium_polyedra.AAC.1